MTQKTITMTEATVLEICPQSRSDPFHTMTDAAYWNRLWWLPDVLLLCQFGLVIFVGRFSLICGFYVKLALLYFAIQVIRRMLRNRSLCEIAGQHDSRPDKTRYVITGHLLTAAFLCYLLLYGKVQVPNIAQVASIAITLCMGVASILTREHYTSDVLWTWLLLGVIMGLVNRGIWRNLH